MYAGRSNGSSTSKRQFLHSPTVLAQQNSSSTNSDLHNGDSCLIGVGNVYSRWVFYLLITDSNFQECCTCKSFISITLSLRRKFLLTIIPEPLVQMQSYKNKCDTQPPVHAGLFKCSCIHMSASTSGYLFLLGRRYRYALTSSLSGIILLSVYSTLPSHPFARSARSSQIHLFSQTRQFEEKNNKK